MADDPRRWERILRRALVLADYGCDLSGVRLDEQGRQVLHDGTCYEHEPFSDDWIVNWWGEPVRDYVQDELDAVNLMMSESATRG